MLKRSTIEWGKAPAFPSNIALLLLGVFFKKLILCGLLNSAEQFVQDFFVLFPPSCIAMFVNSLQIWHWLLFSVRGKVALLFVTKEFSCFGPAGIKPGRGFVSRPGAASGGNLFSNPRQGESTGEPQGAETCNHYLVIL